MLCPVCGTQMDDGWLVLSHSLFGTKLRWQRDTDQGPSTAPGESEADAEAVVIKARFSQDPKMALRCGICQTLVVPGDSGVDGD